jgi:hypothetical protein
MKTFLNGKIIKKYEEKTCKKCGKSICSRGGMTGFCSSCCKMGINLQRRLNMWNKYITRFKLLNITPLFTKEYYLRDYKSSSNEHFNFQCNICKKTFSFCVILGRNCKKCNPRKLSIKTRRNISKGMIKTNGSGLSQCIRNLQEYKDWCHKVFEDSNYTCKICGSRGGTLHAHHPHPMSFAFILRMFLSEYSQFSPIEDKETLIRLAIGYKPFWEAKGETICKKCHYGIVHTFLKKSA